MSSRGYGKERKRPHKCGKNCPIHHPKSSKPCTVNKPHNATECNGTHLDLSDA